MFVVDVGGRRPLDDEDWKKERERRKKEKRILRRHLEKRSAAVLDLTRTGKKDFRTLLAGDLHAVYIEAGQDAWLQLWVEGT